jgi:putative ABC transport system substrate-binding protein
MQFGKLKRREFVTLLGGAAGWPLAARAQQGERMRRIGVLMPTSADDLDQQANLATLLQQLQELGWRDGANVRIETRWSAAAAGQEIRRHAADLVALAPDVIVANGTATVGTLLQATRSVPIVFCNVADPVGAGFVKTMARPGGNATGFIQFEYTLSGKWLELLKEIAPRVARVAVLRDDGITSGIGQFAVIRSVAAPIGVEVSAIGMRNAGDIEREINEFGARENGGLILTSSALAIVRRGLVIALATQHKLPAIYYRRAFVASGCLISYGYDVVAQFRGAASYADRILKGERPADLPVQAPTKYELVINLKTARALGLEIAPALIARADEVIE